MSSNNKNRLLNISEKDLSALEENLPPCTVLRIDSLVFTDDRGTITDLRVTPDYSITHITFNKDSIRGNHWHNKTKQIDVILKGKLLSRKTIINPLPHETGLSEAILEAGMEAVHWPTEKHAYKALEDSEMISICFGVRKGTDYEKDTFRLEGKDKLI